jgi:hypothetical protein
MTCPHLPVGIASGRFPPVHDILHSLSTYTHSIEAHGIQSLIKKKRKEKKKKKKNYPVLVGVVH